MSTTDLRPPPSSARSQPSAVHGGPSARAVAAALTTGLLAAVLLVLVVAPGAPEPVTTGLALLSFAAGWGLLGLHARRTGVPQRWADALAAVLGASGLVLLVLTPGDAALAAAAWVWPPVLLGLVLWSAGRARRDLPRRSRWLVVPVLGVLALAAVGALVQGVAVARDATRAAAPGRLLDVGGHRLHLHCTGAGTPTVVLESGLGGSSPLWGRITAGAARTTRVCAYDRAGTGWSEDAPGPRDGRAVVADLHRLLAVSGEPGPYVLVGHSAGGAYVMTYTAQHPEQVAGMVLLDAVSPHQFTVLPDYPAQYRSLTRLFGVLPTLHRLGVGRLAPALFANDVPGKAGAQASAFAVDPRSAGTARDELATYRRTFAQAQALRSLGRTPLVVLSADDTLDGTAGWADAQQALAGLSSGADLRRVRSSHLGLLDDPTASRASVTAIGDVVDAVRTAAAVRSR